MVRHGYPAPFAASLQATAAELGVIIPPSIPMILFAVSTDTSTGELFIAGVLPGILIAAALMAYVWFYARRHGYGLQNRAAAPGGVASAAPGMAGAADAGDHLGRCSGGVFTPTEASVVAVVYALVVGMLVYRRISVRGLSVTLRRSAISTAAIMFIIADAGVFGFLLQPRRDTRCPGPLAGRDFPPTAPVFYSG